MTNDRMNEELTNEVLEAMAVCKGEGCSLCEAQEVCMGNRLKQFNILATALLEERAKPKVWDGAPEDAVSAVVTWCRSGEIVGSVSYNRELPKTRIDKIVDEVLDGYLFGLRVEKGELTEILKSALNKYAEELKGEA